MLSKWKSKSPTQNEYLATRDAEDYSMGDMGYWQVFLIYSVLCGSRLRHRFLHFTA